MVVTSCRIGNKCILHLLKFGPQIYAKKTYISPSETKMADIISAPKRLFVIDTDVGLDDAQAIFMTLSASDVRLLGITTVRGNAPSARQVALKALRVLKVANSLEVSTLYIVSYTMMFYVHNREMCT
jgi:hypothetical protein